MSLTTRTPALLAVVALMAATESYAWRYCQDQFGRVYRCSGLSNGARIALGVCVGVGVFLLIMILGGLMRRKRQNQTLVQYQTPVVTNTGYNAPTTGYDSSNPYANNPPPPTGTYGEYAGGGFAAPTSPPNTYQPQGQATYNGNTGGEAANYYGTKDTPLSGKDNELADHSYEYTQAQQNAAAAGNPPVYDGYAAPAGPPPGKN